MKSECWKSDRCLGVRCSKCLNTMTYAHYLNHLERCREWASVYSSTGAYIPTDMDAFDAFEKKSVVSSKSSYSPERKKTKLHDLSQQTFSSFSDRKLGDQVISSYKSSIEAAQTESSGFKLPDNRRQLKSNLLKRLQQDLQQFKQKIYEEYESDLLTKSDIDQEITKTFIQSSSPLKLGYIKLENVIRFAKHRFLTERRLLKSSCLPDCPSDEEIRLFALHFNTKRANIEDLVQKRITNNPLTHRRDKGQLRIPIPVQIEVMKFIHENSCFAPRRNGIITKKAIKIPNLGSRIFLR